MVKHGTCNVCGCSFTYEHEGRGRLRRYCDMHRKLPNEAKIVIRHCEMCGIEIRSAFKSHRFCDVCRPIYKLEANRQWMKLNRSNDEGGNINHRAQKVLRKKYGQVLPLLYERINKRKVLDRDHWMCSICGLPIDKHVKFPDTRCATIDHCIPLAMGGSHTYENVRAAHFKCNCSKGIKVMEVGGLQSLAPSPM
jgi:hypothetical protein